MQIANSAFLEIFFKPINEKGDAYNDISDWYLDALKNIYSSIIEQHCNLITAKDKEWLIDIMPNPNKYVVDAPPYDKIFKRSVELLMNVYTISIALQNYNDISYIITQRKLLYLG